MTLDECIGGARDTIIEAAEYDKDFLSGMSRDRCSEWLSEHLHEAIDGAVPVYNHDIASLFADARVWSQDAGDLGDAQDVMQAVQWAIYMAIEEALNEDDSILDGVCDIAGGVEA